MLEPSAELLEAVDRVEFWTLTLGGETALGSTQDQAAGELLGGVRGELETISNPGARPFWAVKVGRYVAGADLGRVENPLFTRVLEVLERRQAA